MERGKGGTTDCQRHPSTRSLCRSICSPKIQLDLPIFSPLQQLHIHILLYFIYLHLIRISRFDLMALAHVLGYRSNDALGRSLKPAKTDDQIDELSPTLSVENIGQFISLPPYADVRGAPKRNERTQFDCILASKVSPNGQRTSRSSENPIS